MFKIDPAPTFPATVPITVPGRESKPLSIEFKHMTVARFTEFLGSARELPMRDLLGQMVHASTDKPEGEDLIDWLMTICDSYPAAGADIFATFRKELVESKVKN